MVVAFDAAGAGVLQELPADVPAVAAIEAGRLPDSPRITTCLDEWLAAAAATRHLLGLGHRTVHHAAIPSETDGSGRQAGWRDALLQAGSAVPPVVAAGCDARSAFEAGRRLAADPEVTAILCGNDDTPWRCAAPCTRRAGTCPAT